MRADEKRKERKKVDNRGEPTNDDQKIKLKKIQKIMVNEGVEPVFY